MYIIIYFIMITITNDHSGVGVKPGWEGLSAKMKIIRIG